jgi:hypothetical protein
MLSGAMPHAAMVADVKARGDTEGILGIRESGNVRKRLEKTLVGFALYAQNSLDSLFPESHRPGAAEPDGELEG